MWTTIFLLGIFGTCFAVDIETSKEGSCLNPPPKVVDFNMTAVSGKAAKHFVPFLSKFDAYNNAEILKGKEALKTLTDEEIKTSCLIFFREETGSLCIGGFKDLKSCYDIKNSENGSTIWKHKEETNWEGAGKTWITKMGKDYFVSVDCWPSGQKSFAVGSVKETLSPEDKADIIEHLKSLGFKPEYFYELTYDKCSLK